MDSYSEEAQGRGLYMWLLFVRNGACGGERRREGSQRSAEEMQSLRPVYTCVSVLMCVFARRRKGVYFFLHTHLCELVCARVGVQGQGKRDGAKGEGHNALGEGDQICGARW